jgi:hypothetical protein
MQLAKASAPFGCVDAAEGVDEEVLVAVAVELSCAT